MRWIVWALQSVSLLGGLYFIDRFRRRRYGSSEARAHRSGITTLQHSGEADGV